MNNVTLLEIFTAPPLVITFKGEGGGINQRNDIFYIGDFLLRRYGSCVYSCHGVERERVFGRKLCYKYSVLVAPFDIAELVHVPNCKKKKVHVTNALCVL